MKPDAPQLRPLLKPLATLRRKLRVIACMRGIGRILLLVASVALLTGTLDYLFHLPGPVRMVILLGLIGSAVVAFARWIVRPLLARIAIDTIAAQVEQHNPWLQDQLRSSLSFSGAATTGSTLMQEQVQARMLQSVARVDFQGIADTSALRKTLLWLLIPLSIYGSLAWFRPALLKTGFTRLISPYGDARWPRSVQIDLVSAVPDRIPIGQRLELSARLTKGDRPTRQVIVNWQIDKQAVQQQIMQRNADGTYSTSVDVRPSTDANAALMSIWIECGDDTLSPRRIVLVPRLQVRSVSLVATPPTYTTLPAATYDLRQQPAAIPSGSKARLTLGFSRGVEQVQLDPIGPGTNPTAPDVTWSRVGNDTFSADWTADASFRFRINAFDQDGFASTAAEEFEVIARPDQLPVIQLESPRRSEERTAESLVPLSALIEDDYGVWTLSLEARLLLPTSSASPATSPTSTQPVSLPLVENGVVAASEATFAPENTQQRRRRFHAGYPWKLLTFPSPLLQPGNVIEFQLATRDNYSYQGQTHLPVRTPPLRITIISQDQLLQRAYDELRQIASRLEEIRARQDRLRADTGQLEQDIAAKSTPDKSDDAIAARIVEQQQRAASQAREEAARLAAITTRLEENASPNRPLRDTLAKAASAVNSAADEQMKPAGTGIKQAADHASTPEKRDQLLKDAQSQQRRASEQLSLALDALGDVGGVGRAIDLVHELLKEQQKLSDQVSDFAHDNAGKKPDDMPPDEKSRMEKLAAEQNVLSQKTQATMEQLRGMAQRQGASDPQSAEALRQAAQTAEEQSVSQHQQRAGEAISQNQSHQASSSQQSAESGLQQMLNGLKEAQRRKLEQLLRQLASLQEQLQLLARRQAGHNLDNLLLRHADGGPNAKLAADLKQRATGNAAGQAASVEQLAASQQQTHRNAADLLEQLDKVRGASDVSASLGRAVSQMERAVAILRDGKLDAAFTPPQVEALANLEDAIAQLKQLRKQSEEQQGQDKSEQLRKAYEQVRDQQIQVRDATRIIDQALTGDKKRRSDLVRLNQIAADQLKLADVLRPLSEQLNEMDSNVFARVSQETGADMGRVSALLSEQKTGKPAQMGQAQILARLDAIIRALTPPKPDESKYETPSKSASGESGQSGKKPRKLPPAAELILIRDLQQLVNAQSKDITPQDTEVLPGLSRQQASLRLSLEQLIRKVSPDSSLPDEQASRELVPEEKEPAPDANIDALDAELLASPPPGQKENPDIQLLARRMSRSSIRLGELKDPGPVTQVVQERILKTLDTIIEEAKRNQPKQQDQDQQDQQQSQEAKPDKSQQKPQSKNSSGASKAQTPAGQSLSPQAKNSAQTPTGDIRETAKEWGGVSQRDRQAIIESTGENIIEKYRALTEEYYRALSNKAAEKK